MQHSCCSFQSSSVLHRSIESRFGSGHEVNRDGRSIVQPVASQAFGNKTPRIQPQEIRFAPERSCLDCRSEEHTSELQSLMRISYAVFCLQTQKTNILNKKRTNTVHYKHHTI